MDLATKIASEITIFSKYARFLPAKKRRETWAEIVQRYIDMMVKKYPSQELQIQLAGGLIYEKKVLPSMRMLQFAGPPIEKNNSRGYNCGFLKAEKVTFFKTLIFLLLGGTGVGYSVQNRHISKLPTIKKAGKAKKWLVGDSIEGWADSVGGLMRAFLLGKPLPKFDYSDIREKGALLVTAGGKAPGPGPLRICHDKILALLETKPEGSQLTSTEVSDIACYLADAVLAGGIRRAAMIALFDSDDKFMLNYKSGAWWESHPERGRVNVSAVLNRVPLTEDEFKTALGFTRDSGSGEPGVYLTNNLDWGTNPCLPPWTLVITPAGLRELREVDKGDHIWSKEGWTRIVKKWSTGVKDVYRYKTSGGTFYGTKNHKIVQRGVKVQVEKATHIDIIKGWIGSNHPINPQDVMDGLVIGDGSVHKASNNLVYLCVGKKDEDYLSSEVSPLLVKRRQGLGPSAFEIKTTITASELPKTYNREIPQRFLKEAKTYRGFLRGLFSANGSVCGSRITLKATSLKLLEDVQLMLSALEIRSYITKNKAKETKFNNGVYLCRESYDLNISKDRDTFCSSIGFLQKYKMEKIKNIKGSSSLLPSVAEIQEVEYVSTEEVFDITVDNPSHTFWNQGCDVSNCGEIALRSEQFCNLSTINLTTVKDQADLNVRATVAAFLGTLQAGFTDFHYLDHKWEENSKEEALLGISITGVADQPNAPETLDFKEACAHAVKQNQITAKLIGINEAARVTCIKPEGCQVKDTMVVTDQGILELQEIGDLAGKQWQEHKFQVNAEKTDCLSTKFFVNGFSKTKKITLNSGLTLEATLNHRYKVLTEDGNYIWKEASDINVGDKLPYRVGGYTGETKKILTFNSYLKSKHDATKHALSYPAHISEDIAWFLGLYWGDGSTHAKGIRISGDVRKQEELKKAAEIVFREFGVKHKVCDYSHKNTNDNRCQYYWNSQQLLAFMLENNLLKPKSEDLEIPIWLRKESANIIKAFIDGYGAADGCEVAPCRSFVTVSKKMATQLVVVLRAIGIDCKLREMPPTNSSFGKRMRYWVSERKGRNSDHSKQKKELQNGWKLLDKLGLSNLSFDKVVNIVESENNTYDIEVPDGHTYVANSYISHNTASLVLGTASGIHGRHAPFYIRRFRFGRNEPIALYLANKVPSLVVEDQRDPNSVVLELPQKSPAFSIMRQEPPLAVLERVKFFKENWINPGHKSGDNTHNVSVTVNVKDEEWDEVINWMWENREAYNGISLFPYDAGTYVQAPFEECTEEVYNEMLSKLTDIDLSEVVEDNDSTELVQEAACAGGKCEI